MRRSRRPGDGRVRIAIRRRAIRAADCRRRLVISSHKPGRAGRTSPRRGGSQEVGRGRDVLHGGDRADPLRRPGLHEPARVQGLPAGPARARQADGGPPPARRLLLALVRLGRPRHVRHRHARPAVARGDGRRDGRRARPKMAAAFEFFAKLGTPVLLLPRPRRRARGRRRFAEFRRQPRRARRRRRRATRSGRASGCCGAPPTCSATRATRPARRPTPTPRCSPTPPRRSSTCSRSRSAWAARTTCCGAAARATTRCSTPTCGARAHSSRASCTSSPSTRHRIGFTGQLLIEPKPMEPTKHQYDYDAATVYGFLARNGLEGEYKLNIEANHATLAGPQLPPRGRLRGRQRHPRQHRRQPRRSRRTAGTPTSSRTRSRTCACRSTRSCATAASRPAASTSTPSCAARAPTATTSSTPTSAAWTRSPGRCSRRRTLVEDGALAAAARRALRGLGRRRSGRRSWTAALTLAEPRAAGRRRRDQPRPASPATRSCSRTSSTGAIWSAGRPHRTEG